MCLMSTLTETVEGVQSGSWICLSTIIQVNPLPHVMPSLIGWKNAAMCRSFVTGHVDLTYGCHCKL